MLKENLKDYIKNNIIKNNSIDNHLKHRDDYDFIISSIDKHVSIEFKTLNEKIYAILNDLDFRPVCKNCGGATKFKSFKKGFSKFCSKECQYQSNLSSEKAKQTKLEKYGDENYVNKEKAKQTKLEKYGDENYVNIEKYKQTMLAKYGVESSIFLNKEKRLESLRSEDVLAKRVETNKKRYGVAFSFLSDRGRLNQQKTMLERYGVINPMKSQEILKSKNETINRKTFEKYSNLENVKPLFDLNEYRGVSYENRYPWECKVCGTTFEDDVFAGRMPRCPKCYPRQYSKSSFENEIEKYLIDLGVDEIVLNDRTIIKPYELDIYLPDYNLAIEFNGLYWHSELNGKDKDYHLNKTLECEKKGIKLIHIFEDEWVEKQEIVKSIVKSNLGINNKVYARKSKLLEIKNHKEFLEKNHLQGYIHSPINIGLFYEEELVSVLTFGTPRYNKNYDWEILRFATKLGYSVVGGFAKMLKYFCDKYSGDIITYSDRRWFNGAIYLNNNFSLVNESPPAYFYTRGIQRISRIQFQKHKLEEKLQHFDPNLTEWENMQMNGWDRVWDCGNKVFELRRKNGIC